MSHYKERKEKNCLNCGVEVQGRFCHQCGQENVETFETAWHLITHFFSDITHFDGKFFKTLKYLIARPGFVSREYVVGKRAAYLNPIRMYIFTSAIFFLIFFSFHKMNEQVIEKNLNGKSLSDIALMDSANFADFTKNENNGKPMSREEFRHYVDTLWEDSGIQLGGNHYKTKAEYDSLLKGGKKDNWFERKMAYKEIELNTKYKHQGGKLATLFINSLMHSFPQMLFLSLPVFAFILKLLYIRRKQFYYTAHAIFSVHLYVFVFIIALFITLIGAVRNESGWNWLKYLSVLGYLYIFYYEYRAMRNFYQQRRGKTILKYLVLNFLTLFLIIALFMVFSFFSILNL